MKMHGVGMVQSLLNKLQFLHDLQHLFFSLLNEVMKCFLSFSFLNDGVQWDCLGNEFIYVYYAKVESREELRCQPHVWRVSMKLAPQPVGLL